jgi:hypothetical protein
VPALKSADIVQVLMSFKRWCRSAAADRRFPGANVFLGVLFGASKQVRVLSAGTFFCLFCTADRPYELREWRDTPHVFFIPLGSAGGKFVLCRSCRTPFDLECLDESSTAECHELEADVPDFACAVMRRRPTSTLSEQLGFDPQSGNGSSTPKASSADAPAPVQTSRQSLSARSRSRKH